MLNNDDIELDNNSIKKENKNNIICHFMPFCIISTIFIYVLIYFIISFVHNNNFSYYEAKIITSKKLEDYYNSKSLNDLESKIIEYNKKAKENNNKNIYYSSVTTYDEIYKNSKIIKVDDGYLIKVSSKTFSTTQLSSSGKISEGSEKFDKTFNVIFTTDLLIDTSNYEYSYVGIVGFQNPYLISTIVSISFLVCLIITFIILFKLNKIIINEDIHDNENIFKTPFHKKYFKYSISHFKNTKDIVTISLLFALMLALKAIKLPSGFGSLGLNLVYLAFAAIGMLYGPLVGLTIGFFSDVLGFFIFPSAYGFFPGYTFDAMISGFMYGIFFYKTRLSYSKCFYSRLFVNLFVNVFMGSIWWSIINNFDFNAYINYMFIISLPKNLIYLIPQSLLLFIILKPTARVASSFSIMDRKVYDNFSFF